MHRLGIRREDKAGERRVPLTPAEVDRLTSAHGVDAVVQPAPRRVFDDEDYRGAGATLDERLDDCGVIMGVKEIPINQLQSGKAYVFFSHTIKGQPYNMPLLRRLMELGCTLIDYERIVDDEGRRLVFFGRHAGLAGMIDTLWTLGRRGVDGLGTVRQARDYASLAQARGDLEALGREIAREGTGLDHPLVVGLSGYGNVSAGAQEILDLLEPAEITPDQLLAGELPDAALIKVVFHEHHMVAPLEGAFDLDDYYARPEGYRPLFGRYLPHLDALVNCIYWEERYPRLVTLEQLRELYAQGDAPRLGVIGDISCDIGGSVEATVKATTQDRPVFVYDPLKASATDGLLGRGVAIMAVGNLPAELPREASESFSAALSPFIPGLLAADFTGAFSTCALPAPLRRAVIVHRGELTEDYAYLQTNLNEVTSD
jgi:saccharopine dehydrogenase (NAD+, L-lysine-forming)